MKDKHEWRLIYVHQAYILHVWYFEYFAQHNTRGRCLSDILHNIWNYYTNYEESMAYKGRSYLDLIYGSRMNMVERIWCAVHVVRGLCVNHLVEDRYAQLGGILLKLKWKS